MPQGGRLTIETAILKLDSARVADFPDMPPGRYTQLAISDTGRGMDKNVMARLFAPFFTTKEKGKGTGLGLAIVYGIIKQFGGYIHVHSRVG